mmetsp:Transcript_34227/g.79069  ORF Transcript_34227/g.79069 Transcript_34227/m.79069 type:complete len:221 (+) Transcript_34227:2109-2771(+)
MNPQHINAKEGHQPRRIHAARRERVVHLLNEKDQPLSARHLIADLKLEHHILAQNVGQEVDLGVHLLLQLNEVGEALRDRPLAHAVAHLDPVRLERRADQVNARLPAQGRDAQHAARACLLAVVHLKCWDRPQFHQDIFGLCPHHPQRIHRMCDLLARRRRNCAQKRVHRAPKIFIDEVEGKKRRLPLLHLRQLAQCVLIEQRALQMAHRNQPECVADVP